MPSPTVPTEPPIWKDVLAALPPGRAFDNVEFASTEHGVTRLVVPMIELYCDADVCQRMMFAQSKDSGVQLVVGGDTRRVYFDYQCRHCGSLLKTIALLVKAETATTGVVVKVGEWPPFSPHIPSRVVTLLGSDREMFLKGRRAESQGMGIGAFAYYRRVVESRKDELIEEIIKVAAKVKAPADVIASLDAASKETQFSNAMSTVKVPESLLIEGHNPLLLLHSAISEGLHAESDEECLESAQAIRNVLIALVQRIQVVMKAEDELRQSVSKLMQKQSAKSSPAKA